MKLLHARLLSYLSTSPFSRGQAYRISRGSFILDSR